ncbi:hypothetical protein CNMCM8980_006893 [Aspergillus fumigatiaffinis]|uniref:Zn(2)-C6 fungal-type domain-containing protein n=1 Tax=Aspergillus fumigatiaffinis TaxID=340414 RepID=A0A8H4H6T0_9EURO|nr:hypothetical protein CNMCM5878_009542 [Aspergillus fumigatiaffinis]KAF4230563.1 hypothetical protein CNMCM6457_005908 [Aspergillus fumigatiaffinis]KAF4237763.1 hypothetical protein CNMCM6805_006820 [Aspergillus fumigatiaffinis]KAF4247825.1 hypothetical protein CNMCM8980_006893 [Aspergillus fumigatiaffinis]
MPASESSNDGHQCDSCFKTYQRHRWIPGDLLLRHRRRCLRSNKPKIRRKACNACVLAKTKCCCTQPTCSRCAKRGISCEYLSTANTAAAIPSDSPDSSSSPSTRDHPRPDETPVSTTDFPSLWSPRSMLGGPGADSFDSWSSQNFIWTMDTLDFPSLPSSAGLVDEVNLDPTPAVPISHPSFTLPLAPAPSQPYNTPVEISMVPPDPGIPDTSTLTGLGGSPDVPGVQPSNYVRLLAQYPRLLLQDDFNCPFVHRTLFNEQVADMTILPHTSMAICCGSALSSRDAVGYVKRAMDAQRQSLIESYWDALHAMLLYEILEMALTPVDESESWKQKRRTKGLKSPFLSKMTQCFSRSYLESHDTALLPAADANSTNSWVKWAVAETARRTIFLANIVNFFSNRDLDSGRQSPYYEPLNDELVMKMPLPCDQGLWSARTEDEWRKATPASPGSLGITDAFSTFGVAAGDIPVGEQLPNGQYQPSLEVLFSKFSKGDLRANCATNAGFADSNELRSFIILCALEQFS